MAKNGFPSGFPFYRQSPREKEIAKPEKASVLSRFTVPRRELLDELRVPQGQVLRHHGAEGHAHHRDRAPTRLRVFWRPGGEARRGEAGDGENGQTFGVAIAQGQPLFSHGQSRFHQVG